MIFLYSSSLPLEKIDKTNFREILGLKNDMEVFYLMQGKYDGLNQEAYLHITKDYYKNDIINITLPKQDKNFDIAIDSPTLYFGLDNKKLVIYGNYNGVDFSFIEDSNAKINNIYFIESSLSKSFIANDEYKSEYNYEARITKPIILDSTLKNIDKLNKSISNNLDVKSLKENLDSILKANLKEYGNLDFNVEYIRTDSVGYIDDWILEIDTFIYLYSGGAHGNSTKLMQLYNIESGESIPSSFEAVFDINNNNKEKFLALLSKSLEDKKDFLFEFPIYILPNSFFLNTDGIIFMWNTYEISPYASGMITTKISFDEVAQYLRDCEVGKFINKMIAKSKE